MSPTKPHSPAPDTVADRYELIDTEEVARIIGMTTDWVYEQSRRGRIPTITLGRYRRYRRAAIEAWLLSIETGCLDPIAK